MKKGGFEWLQMRAARVQLQAAFDALGRAFIELSQLEDPPKDHLQAIAAQLQQTKLMIDETDEKLNET